MTVTVKETKDECLIYPLETSNGWVMGIYPVIFGMRVRVRQADDETGYLIDYCAGADNTALEVLYSLVLSALKNGRDPETEFPAQLRKPLYNDPLNFSKLVELADVNGPNYKYQMLADMVRKRNEAINKAFE